MIFQRFNPVKMLHKSCLIVLDFAWPTIGYISTEQRGFHSNIGTVEKKFHKEIKGPHVFFFAYKSCWGTMNLLALLP